MKLSNINLIKQGDLALMYDNLPELSHYKDSNNNHYLVSWCGLNYGESEWLVFKVSSNDFKEFFNNKLSLLQLIEFSEDLRFIERDDIDVNMRIVYEEQIKYESLNSDYLPTEKLYYEENQYEQPYSNNLKQELNESK